MVGLQTLDLAIGVRVPASQPKKIQSLIGQQQQQQRPRRRHRSEMGRSVGEW